MSAALGAQVKRFEETEQRFPPAIFQIDWLLLLAAIGLAAAGVYVVGTATHGDIPGNPDYYLTRQAAYGGVGVVLMLLLTRFDYSRLREWKLGIYGIAISLILLTLALGSATRGSKPWINLPSLNLQPPQPAKTLQV